VQALPCLELVAPPFDLTWGDRGGGGWIEREKTKKGNSFPVSNSGRVPRGHEGDERAAFGLESL